MDELEFKNHLKKYLNKIEIEQLFSSFEKDENKGLYLNKNYINKIDEIDLPGIAKHPFVENAFIFKKNKKLGKHVLFNIGAYYIQEPSSTLSPFFLPIEDGDLILDMCAAPGGKAIFAANKNKNGVLIANDVSISRCNSLIENIERLGVDNVIVTSSDLTSEKITDSFKETFDKIILDAPCSGSGMFRKNDEFYSEWSLNKVLKFQETQKILLKNAFKMLKKGGIISYSTCSYSYEEDEEVVRFLLENENNAELIPLPSNKMFVKSDMKESIHLLPSRFPGEGQFICLIHKKGESSKTIYKPNLKCQINKEFKHDLENRSNLIINNCVYSLNKHFDAKPLYIIRYGVKALEKIGRDFKPTHHYAKALNSSKIDLNEKQISDYIDGLEIPFNSTLKSWVTLTYKNIPVGLGKISNNRIKNHYPKGLRKKRGF